MTDSLQNKAVKGVSWSFVETFSLYSVKFIIGIVLARLLMPSDFGMLAIMMVFISISDKLVDAGFGQAYIHKTEVDNRDANTVFAINFAISVVLYGLLFALAPIISEFYDNSSLKLMLRILSFAIIISSLNVVQNAIVRRNFLFKKRALISVSSALLSASVGIGCAYNGYGVWSLIIQQLIEKSLNCILLYLSLNWRLTLSFSKQSAYSMFNYGTWVLAANIIAVIFNNIYRLSIGKLFTTSDLGYYERAKQFENLIADTFTGIVGKVAFPTFSRAQDNKEELYSLTTNFVKFSSFFVLPLLGCLCVLASPLIIVVLTDKWISTVVYLQLLCCVGFFWPFYYFIPPLLQAIGQTRLCTILTATLCFLRLLNIAVTYKYGISAIIIGELCCVISIIFIAAYLSKDYLGFNYLTIFRDSLSIIMSALGASFLGYLLLHFFMQGVSNYIQLGFGLMIICFTYFAFVSFFDRDIIRKIIKLKELR